MSTLVNILLAIVLNVLSTGSLQQEAKSISNLNYTGDKVQCVETIKDLRPHYLISREEFVSQIN